MSLPRSEPAVDTPDGPRSVIAVLAAMLALSLPGWAYLAHAWAVSDVRRVAPDLSNVAETTVSARWNPLPDAADTVVAIRVLGEEPGTAEAVAAALLAEGYQPTGRLDTYRRPADLPSGRAGAGGSALLAVVVAAPGGEPGGTGPVAVHLTQAPWTPRHAFPAVLYGTTALIGLTVLVARSGTSARRLLGVVSLILTALQAVLLIRALWLAGTRVDQFVADTGPLTPSRLRAAEPEPALERLRAEVGALAAPLRAFGSATVLALLPLWLLGSLAAFSPRQRATLASLAGGIVVVALIAIGFEPEGSGIRDVLAREAS